jgi:stage II sporulation protein E
MNTMGVTGLAQQLKRMWENALVRAGGADQAREWAFTFGAMVLCSRARVGPGHTPFAAAYFAVSLAGGASLTALLGGCLIGALMTGVTPASLFTPAGCAIALSMWLLWDRLRRGKWAARLDGSMFTPMAAGLAVLLPGLAAAGYAPVAWLVALAAAVAAAVMATGDYLLLRRTRTSAGLMLWACAVVIFSGSVGIDPGPVAAFFAAAASAAGRGALTGAGLGAVCLMCGGDVVSLALAGCAGAAGDLARIMRPGAIWRGVASAAAALGMFLWQGASPVGILCCALAAAIPRRISDMLGDIIAPRQAGGEQLVDAFRRKTEAELRSLSDAFSELGEACGADDPAFGEQQLITGMRAALCTGCPEYAHCWPGMNSRAVKLFCQLMTASIERGTSPFDGGEVPPDILRLCRRGMMIPARLGSMLSDFAAQRHRRLRLMGARRLIAAEFNQAAALINAMAQEQARPVSIRDGAAARARAALGMAGLPVTEVTAIMRGRLDVTVELTQPWNAPRLRRAAAALENALGKSFSQGGVNGCRAAFVSGSAMNAPAAASMLPADPDSPSGDSHMVRDLGEGRLLIALSDGMGSGEAAAEESRRVLRLLHSLMSAGIPRELALAAVNGVMLARGGEEMFATVDMLLIDLCAGRGEFTKLSACRSYILRDGRVSAVEGGRLPLGILEEVQPALSAVKLKPGDVIVMMTDGVADVLPEDVLEDLMIQSSLFDPPAMSEALVNAAAARAPRRRDDMTALCVKLEPA